MAPTTTKERPNKVNISDVGPSRKKIEIEIPAETVAEQLGTSMDTLSADAELPGFRRGHVPRRLIEKKFGTTVRREAKNQLVASAYNKAVEDHKIRVIGDAAAGALELLEIRDGEPLKFEVEVEVLPEFTVPALDGIAVKKPIIEVSDEAVEKDIERLRLNEGSLKDKAQPTAGDYLTGHAVMTDAAGKTILDIPDAVIQVPTADRNGRGMILGVMVDDFETQLGRPAVGQSVTVKTVGPETHENEAIRGKAITVAFKVKTSQEIVPADLEEIARRSGMTSDEEVRTAVRQRIEQRVQVEQQTAMRQQISQHLLEHTGMELPERVTAQQAARNLERTRMELAYRGVDPMKIEEQLADLRSSSQNTAVRELKMFFILDKAAEALGIKVSDQEVNGRIAQMAMSRGERPEKLRQEIVARSQIGIIYNQIREHKTLDAILAKANVQEVGLEEYNAHIEAADRGAKASPPSTPAPQAAAKPAPKKEPKAAEKPPAPEKKGGAKAEPVAKAPKGKKK